MPTGYVNYVNGVPIEEMVRPTNANGPKDFNSPQPKTRKKIQGRNETLP
jgi:hypothetical protein